MSKRPPFVRCTLPLALALAFPAAHAADSAKKTAGEENNVFTLGQITVTASRPEESALGTASVNREELWDFGKDGLPEALNLIPGVASTPGSGNRNESLISIRGFDRWQVPLLMDGIRLYLPADNRIDFDRFLTPDLAEIQVSKGYVSVLNGPDGMGGAINLVTRKPVKAFEAEVRGSMSFGNDGKYSGNTVYANVGSRQEMYYLQASVEQRDVDHWRLSKDFTPTKAENGGDRDRSDKQDWRVNLKAGLTPNATDEYSLNFVKQSGEKHGIGAVTGTSAISTWDWPTWDTTSLYWLSHTQLDPKTYLKTRAYYTTFDNTLVMYSNTALTTQNSISWYDDNSKGLSLEIGTDHLPQQTLKASVHYRRDTHGEWSWNRLAQNSASAVTPANFTEPKQTAIEDTTSVALEDTWHLSPQIDLVAGISHDSRSMKQAEEFASPGGGAASRLFNQPVADSSATNYQGAAIYRYSPSGKTHFSISDRTRFPNMFERFSSRFGGAISNPGLKPERALNTEIGIEDNIAPGVRGSAAVFHSSVDDAIQSVSILYNGASYNQSQNVGKATFQGVEFSLNANLLHNLDVGGNYSYIDTQIDNPNDSKARLTTTPRNKFMAYAKWKPIAPLTVIPSIEYGGPRWSTLSTSSSTYIKTGEYVLANLKLEYRISPTWDIALSGRNLLDKNYAPVEGYPQQGRNFVLSTRLQF